MRTRPVEAAPRPEHQEPSAMTMQPVARGPAPRRQSDQGFAERVRVASFARREPRNRGAA